MRGMLEEFLSCEAQIVVHGSPFLKFPFIKTSLAYTSIYITSPLQGPSPAALAAVPE